MRKSSALALAALVAVVASAPAAAKKPIFIVEGKPIVIIEKARSLWDAMVKPIFIVE